MDWLIGILYTWPTIFCILIGYQDKVKLRLFIKNSMVFEHNVMWFAIIPIINIVIMISIVYQHIKK